MEQNFTRGPIHNIEPVLQRWSNHDAQDGDRFALVPGTLSLLLERGYSLGRPTQQLRGEPVLDLNRYRFLLVPAEVSQNRAANRLTYDATAAGLPSLTWPELIAHLKRELGEPPAPKPTSIVEFGDVRVDLSSHEVWRSNRPVRLSAMEFKVLKFFVANPLRVISRDEFLNEVWGYNSYPCTRTVDNHVLRLRRRVEPNPSKPIYFQTVSGFGYRFAPRGDAELNHHG